MTFSAAELSRTDTPYWFCLKAQPKREHIAAANLRQIPTVETFAPQIRFKKATQRGAVWFVEALFPGYLFARFRYAELHRQIRSAPGVSTIVHFGDRFATLDQDVIAHLATKAGDNSVIVFNPEFKPGDQVQISDGPLRGLEGVITRLIPSRERVAVLLQFLDRSIEAEVAKNELISSVAPRSA